MREKSKELARLWQCAITRPRRQWAVAVLISAWSLAWIAAQVVSPTSPLGVIAGIAPAGWLDATGDWAIRRPALFTGLAVVAGLCWAATTERAQAPALVGWLSVLMAGESIGYVSAVHTALITTAAFIAVLALLSLAGRRAFVVDRIALIPKDVLRAAATAVALSAVVPLVAPGVVVARLLRPYLTRPPRFDPTRPRIPQARRGEEAGEQRGNQVPAR